MTKEDINRRYRIKERRLKEMIKQKERNLLKKLGKKNKKRLHGKFKWRSKVIATLKMELQKKIMKNSPTRFKMSRKMTTEEGERKVIDEKESRGIFW